MSNLRKVQLLGVGVLTPALMGHPQTAEARSVDYTSAVQIDAAIGEVATPAAAKALLYREVFTRTPAEKLRIAGDRIRLSMVKKNSAQSDQKIPNKTGSRTKNVKRDIHINPRYQGDARGRGIQTYGVAGCNEVSKDVMCRMR